MDIYKEIILDHWKNPHNFGSFGSVKGRVVKKAAVNPSCGDQVSLELLLAGRKITDARFSGAGCAISQAAASLLTDFVKGKRLEDLKKINEKSIINLLGVAVGPSRKKCALLPLAALQQITQGKEKKS